MQGLGEKFQQENRWLKDWQRHHINTNANIFLKVMMTKQWN